MEVVTNKQRGLFPKPSEIKMRCSCPDYAGMCKHVAATMYGVGNRLDASPELLFVLRGVEHKELIEQAIPAAPAGKNTGVSTLAEDDLADIFGINLGDEATPQTEPSPAVAVKKKAPTKTAKAKSTKKTTALKKKPIPKKG
jgi:uncharacterized Zn finger protein